MVAESVMTGDVIVDNNTGHVIKSYGCGSLFQVALGNATIQPPVFWPLCEQRITLPTGVSRYPVRVSATYLGCTSSAPTPAIPKCPLVDPPFLPPLPAGTYHADLYQSAHVVPTPPPITVHVIAPGSPAP